MSELRDPSEDTAPALAEGNAGVSSKEQHSQPAGDVPETALDAGADERETSNADTPKSPVGGRYQEEAVEKLDREILPAEQLTNLEAPNVAASRLENGDLLRVTMTNAEGKTIEIGPQQDLHARAGDARQSLQQALDFGEQKHGVDHAGDVASKRHAGMEAIRLVLGGFGA